MIESIFIAILIVLIYIFFIKNEIELMQVNINNQRILVRKTKDYQESAKILYELINRMYRLRNHLVSNISSYGEDSKYVTLLSQNFTPEKTLIYENDLNSSYTSYNVNKGEEIVFCLRCKKDMSLHSINVLVYVAVHELAHSGCPEVGHTPLFNHVFNFFLKEAVKIGIYTYENYRASPVMYCGMKLNSQILN
jgi:hypothetical protein